MNPSPPLEFGDLICLRSGHPVKLAKGILLKVELYDGWSWTYRKRLRRPADAWWPESAPRARASFQRIAARRIVIAIAKGVCFTGRLLDDMSQLVHE